MNLLNRLFGETSLRVLVWTSLISEILIVVTGGAVRLTASGLGCPTWPYCTEESLVTVPEMGIHGIIEFGNRLLTFVLLLIAVLTALAARKSGGKRRVFSTSIWLIVGIFVQAVVGGISVLANLNPWVVGLHFVISAAMISIASLQLWRVYRSGISLPAASLQEKRFSWLLVISGALTLFIGVVVTGSGPHAGDPQTPRNGLESEFWQHLHSYPAYLALACSLVLLYSVRKRDVDGYSSRLVFWTTVCLVAQAVVGVTQARLGLPVGLVLIHLTLASVFCSLLTLQWLSLREK